MFCVPIQQNCYNISLIDINIIFKHVEKKIYNSRKYPCYVILYKYDTSLVFQPYNCGSHTKNWCLTKQNTTHCLLNYVGFFKSIEGQTMQSFL